MPFQPFGLLARGDQEAARDTSTEWLEAARLSGRTDELAEALALRVVVLRKLQDPAAPAAVDELVSLLPSFALWVGTIPLIGLVPGRCRRGCGLASASRQAAACVE